MQIGAFLAEIENLCFISEKANDAKNDTAKEANEKGVEPSKSSGMILYFCL